MKRLAIATLLLCGCATNTQTGALIGTGVGAAGGALITGSPTGALIGGAVGAAGGALVGAALDANDRKTLEENSPRTLRKIDRGEQLSISDIEQMSKNGLSDKVIIDQIDATNSVFSLTSQEIIDLKKAGVSQRVIDHMIETGK